MGNSTGVIIKLSILSLLISFGFSFYSPKLKGVKTRAEYVKVLNLQHIEYDESPFIENDEDRDRYRYYRNVQFEGYPARQVVSFYKDDTIDSEMYSFKSWVVDVDQIAFSSAIFNVFAKMDAPKPLQLNDSFKFGDIGEITVFEPEYMGYKVAVVFFK
ncbi:MAG: hypothetical protein PHV30_01565 [Candidatus Margulisbacteria bacterium]|nr:hypothetical protein [Candidatus Margulisiibacteriota bacterium]